MDVVLYLFLLFFIYMLMLNNIFIVFIVILTLRNVRILILCYCCFIVSGRLGIKYFFMFGFYRDKELLFRIGRGVFIR